MENISVGYKRLDYGMVCVLTIPECAITDEGKQVFNSMRAKYFTDHALVEKIYNPFTRKEFKKGSINGQTFEIESYIKSEKGCSISYYKSVEPVIYENINESNWTGMVKKLTDDGRLECEYVLANGVKDGIYKYYDKHEKLIISCLYKKGELNGKKITYYDNDVVKSEEEYSNDLLNGRCVYYFNNKNLKMIKNYSLGRLEGEFLVNHVNGKKKIEAMYSNNDLDGVYTEWYGCENKKMEINYDKGVLEGLYRTWYFNGILSSELNYHQNMLHGECKKYDTKGYLLELETYVEGSLDGLYEKYEDGYIVERKYFRNNKLDGWYTTFYKNGSIKSRIKYVNGWYIEQKADNRKPYYDPYYNQKDSYVQNYYHNLQPTYLLKPVQYPIVYQNPNTCQFQIPYKKVRKRVVSTHNTYRKYRDGILVLFYKHNGKYINGPYMEYWRNGNPKIKAYYENGKLIGTYKEWDNNGNLVYQTRY